MKFRTTDVARWGAGKEAKLTSLEIDENMWELVSRILILEGSPVQPNQISDITLTGSQLTISLDDGTQFGPYTIPVATMRFRGDWAAATQYYQLDLIRVTDQGLFMVMRDHVAFSSFDPNQTSSEGALYSLIMPASGVVPTDFLSLTDTPAGYAGQAGKAIVVNDAATQLTFSDMPQPTTLTNETNFKDDARLATTANVDLATGGLLIIDEIQTVDGDRILVKDQLTKSENGLYTAAEGAWVRTADAPDLASIEGMVIYVQEGTLNGGSLFALTSGTSTETTITETTTAAGQLIIKLIDVNDYTITPEDLGKWLMVRGATPEQNTPVTIRFPMMTDSKLWPRNAELLIHQRTARITFAPDPGVEVLTPYGTTFPDYNDITLRMKIRKEDHWLTETPFVKAVISDDIQNAVTLTQTEYDAIATKNVNTLYLITE